MEREMTDYPQYMKDAYGAWARQLGVVQSQQAMNVSRDPIEAAEQRALYQMNMDVLNVLHDEANAAFARYQAEKTAGGAHG